MSEQTIETFFGRKIAVDASMHIYQFMIAVCLGPGCRPVPRHFFACDHCTCVHCTAHEEAIFVLCG